MIFRLLLFVFINLFVFLAYSQSILGTWKTIDDQTGKPRSLVEIYQRGNKVFGKIVKIYVEPHEDPDPICTECTGERKGKKVIGMEIIQNMVLDKPSGEYEDGEILDPESGNIYDCKLWVEESKLMVRGYVMFVYRTQTWLPVD